MLGGVRHRKVRLTRAKFVEDLEHLSGEDEKRRAAVMRRNFHVLPTDSTPPTRLQCFQSRFFRRKPRCIMLRCYYATTLAVSSLARRVDSFEKTRRAQEHFANSRNFDNVYADGYDHE